MAKGSQAFPSLRDPSVESVLNLIVDRLASLIRHHEASTVVLSGCGTSGRIAWLTARRMNLLLKSAGKEAICEYLIASGDSALLIGQEQGEDDPHRAEADITSVVNSYALITLPGSILQGTLSLPVSSHRRLLYIGITCGMSAPYVASQLFYLLHKAPADLDITGVLFGFNPTDLSRNVPVEVRTLILLKCVCTMTHPLRGLEWAHCAERGR